MATKPAAPVNRVATMTGDVSATLTEDGCTTIANGKLTVKDLDAGQAGTKVLSNVAGTYGTFSVDANGNWKFTLDNSRAATQALASGESATDSFIVYSIDGTASKTVTVTVLAAMMLPLLPAQQLVQWLKMPRTTQPLAS